MKTLSNTEADAYKKKHAHNFRDSVPVPKMNGCYARLLLGYAKISAKFSFPSNRYKAITAFYVNKPLQKVFLCVHTLYLFKLNDIPIIMALTNNTINFCSEISKIRMILRVVYTCNVKGLQEVEKMGRNWMYFGSLTKIIRVERLY